MLCWYDSEDANKAFDFYLKRLIKPGEDHVVLLSIIPASVYKITSSWLPGSVRREQNLEMLRKLRQQTLNEAEKKQKELTEAGAVVTIHIAHGEPKNVIPRLANFHEVDLVITGRCKMSSMERMLATGKVTSHILSEINKPVLIVK